ncbi:MAG: 6-carboxytetrahydropterin synthase [Pyrodictiaceae archaeon]
MARFRACYSTWFSAAMRISSHPRWSRMHGHTFSVKICVSNGELDEHGMLLDYAVLRGLVDKVVSKLDHTVLNDVLGVEDATLEILASWIYERLEESIRGKRLRLDFVEVCSQPDFCVEYER